MILIIYSVHSHSESTQCIYIWHTSCVDAKSVFPELNSINLVHVTKYMSNILWICIFGCEAINKYTRYIMIKRKTVDLATKVTEQWTYIQKSHKSHLYCGFENTDCDFINDLYITFCHRHKHREPKTGMPNIEYMLCMLRLLILSHLDDCTTVIMVQVKS